MSHLERKSWVEMLVRVVGPVFRASAEGRLSSVLPDAGLEWDASRRPKTYWEAYCRSFCGAAPWLGSKPSDPEEARQQESLRQQAMDGLRWFTDPDNPESIGANLQPESTKADQGLVEAAFLACGLLRAPSLLEDLSREDKVNLLVVLKRYQGLEAPRCNWLLFSSVVDTLILRLGGGGSLDAIEDAVSSHEEWYKGDGMYGDGPEYHADYYNSFVIHPLLLDTLICLPDNTVRSPGRLDRALRRAGRYAEILERMIGPDGTYPVLGRSMGYRFGAFHHLGYMALKGYLPDSLPAGQVRSALTAVLDRQFGNGLFDENGWLVPGFTARQPSLMDRYISTGSLYLCSFIFSPLGLGPLEEFWSSPATPWTGKMAWNGQDLPGDHALKDGDHD